MSSWSKGRVVLIGDAAHSVQAMGTSLAMTGAYILARELEKAGGDYAVAFANYEKCLRSLVTDAQEAAEANQSAFTGSTFRMKVLLYVLKIVPQKIIQYLTAKGKKQMKELANRINI
jgi:2-polyprenyl-6-methoxyphenol hydroxylase-like FAD-dependent oxidoreductase